MWCGVKGLDLGQLWDLDQPLEVLQVTGAIEQTLQPATGRGTVSRRYHGNRVNSVNSVILFELFLEAVSVALQGVGWKACKTQQARSHDRRSNCDKNIIADFLEKAFKNGTIHEFLNYCIRNM